MLRLAIAIPTYNEAKNIEALLTRIHAVCSEQSDVDVTAVVLDDSSPDGTGAVVEALAAKLSSDTFRIRVIVKTDKAGLGAAYVNGFRILVAENYDYVLQMDADLSHDPQYVKQFLAEARRGTDLVVGSRYIPGGGTPDWSWNRKFLSRGGNTYARLVLSRRVSDYTGGFNMYSASLLQKIRPESSTANGYGFIIELKYRALRASQSLVEIPIIFLDRTYGVSKMPSGTLMRNFALVLRIRFADGR
jgi:dolichol-phosphate mannosyltransferase